MPLEPTMIALMLVAWNLFLHFKVTRESRLRRELAIAFRQHLVERRSACVAHGEL